MRAVIHTDGAPKAIGPYSQAVKANGMVYTAGQIAIEPKSGELKMDSIEEEVEQVMSNLRSILHEAKSSFEHVVKTTIYVADLELYGKVNELYAKYFKSEPPARSTVEVARLPKDVNVEIDMIAYCPV